MRLAEATILAEDFAKALVAGDFVKAHKKLASSVKGRASPFSLRVRYFLMCLPMRLFGNIPRDVESMERAEDWPTKQRGDVAWVYVSIHGDNAGEAVAVVVCEESPGLAIREIEWGRP